jgi:hypothetical protein
VPPAELHLSQLAEKPFRADSQVLVILYKDTELAGQVQVGLVVGGGRQQDALALVGANILLNGPIPAAFRVSQVVAFVDDHQAITPKGWQLPDHLANGDHPSPQSVLVGVVLPHGNQVLWTDDQRLKSEVILEDSGHSGRHQGLAQTHHVTDEHPVSLVQMVCAIFTAAA